MYQTQKGFTLIELLIVITIAAVMAVIAFPNMNQWIASRRAASQAEQIANLLRFARNEAVRLNLPVYICPVKIKSDGSPNNGCDSKYAGNGMLAYADKNGDSNYKNDTVDLSVRSIILNGDTDKVEYSFNHIPTGTGRLPSLLQLQKKSGGDSCPMVHLAIRPMAKIINFQTVTSKSA